jgi:hypothetical protein
MLLFLKLQPIYSLDLDSFFAFSLVSFERLGINAIELTEEINNYSIIISYGEK